MLWQMVEKGIKRPKVERMLESILYVTSEGLDCLGESRGHTIHQAIRNTL